MALDGFINLGNNILLYPGHGAAHNVNVNDIKPVDDNFNQNDPSLIILCTWLGGASPRHISKYTSHYQQLYPTSSILLIRTVLMDLASRPAILLRKRLIPAAREVAKHVNSVGGGGGGILLHIFSNGGANMAVQLTAAVKSCIPQLTPSPFRMVIFDCCPCFTTFQSQYDAAVFSLPASQPVNALGQMVLFPFVGAVSVLQNVGAVGSGSSLRRDLNCSNVFGPGALRLYLYSKSDKTVPYRHVETHIDDAKQLGYRVYSTRFDDAPHCGLVVASPHKYWLAIQRAWAASTAVPTSFTAKL